MEPGGFHPFIHPCRAVFSEPQRGKMATTTTVVVVGRHSFSCAVNCGVLKSIEAIWGAESVFPVPPVRKGKSWPFNQALGSEGLSVTRVRSLLIESSAAEASSHLPISGNNKEANTDRRLVFMSHFSWQPWLAGVNVISCTDCIVPEAAN
eukprot:TRINITY_DN95704_c0_g1_i1.p2 TRINITY_DN95704_c0_g1~~TRINITY_DN95704_c0_g1_i1.p2  ORF type:complete len:150 (-),score=4.85 TRINITY_DN95704_c0_g1_i1:318-767(-)